jgi:(p)ppGpp synthase/HD superfamily hydrolase
MSTSQDNLQRLAKAYLFAAQKHRKQRRKDSEGTPYINHPIDVANILAEAGVTDTDTLIAGILHDTVEDTGTSAREIAYTFGENVAKVVLECSDDKSLSKIERKKLQIEHAKHISDSAKVVKLADKFSNCNDLMVNRPSNWSDREIKGYAYWAYAVCRQLGGANEKLDIKINEMFESFGIHDVGDNDLQKALEEYYQCIDNSD